MTSALVSPEYRRAFVLGGRAVFTLVGRTSRFTYKVRKHERASPDLPNIYFIDVLAGDQRYTFIGTIFSDGSFVYSVGSRLPRDAPSIRAFFWFWTHINSRDVEVWHEGACSRCSRPLTDPESIARGIGPTCFERG